MTILADSVCGKMNALFDKGFNAIQRFEDAVNKPLRDISNALGNIDVPSDPFGLEAAVKEASDAAIDMIPDLASDLGKDNALIELSNIISSCTYLNTDPLLSDATNMLNQLRRDLISAIRKETFALIDVLQYPEVFIGELLADLQDFLKNLEIQIQFNSLDNLIQCLDAICGANTVPLINKLSTSKANMNLNSVGSLDTTDLLMASGAAIGIIKNVKTSEIAIVEMSSLISNEIVSATGLTPNGGPAISLNPDGSQVIPPVYFSGAIFVNSKVRDGWVECSGTANIQTKVTDGILNGNIPVNSIIDGTMIINEIIISSTLNVISNISGVVTENNIIISSSSNIISNILGDLFVNKIIISSSSNITSNVTGILNVI